MFVKINHSNPKMGLISRNNHVWTSISQFERFIRIILGVRTVCDRTVCDHSNGWFMNLTEHISNLRQFRTLVHLNMMLYFSNIYKSFLSVRTKNISFEPSMHEASKINYNESFLSRTQMCSNKHICCSNV